MKHIKPIIFDDNLTFINMSLNKRLRSRTSLLKYKNKILSAYDLYRKKKGNVASVKALRLPLPFKDIMRNHYALPPKELAVIKEIRSKLSPNVCAMCGSFHTATLDHVFPKSAYAEYSFFTKNLVPACQCNSLRGDISTGGRGERVLHPYFDEVFSQRLVIATFSGEMGHPNIELKICYTNGPAKNAVHFHVENVLFKTNVISWMDSQWSILLRDFRILVPELPNKIVSIKILDKAISDALGRCDSEFQTPNNWKSIFLAGLDRDQNAKDFFMRHWNGIKRGRIDPNDF